MAYKTLVSFSTNITIDVVGYVRQPASWYVLFLKKYTQTTLVKQEIALIVQVDLHSSDSHQQVLQCYT